MPRDYGEADVFEDDFKDEMTAHVLVQTFLRNDGYKNIFSEGITYDCHVQSEIFNITKSDGTLTPTTMQIYLPGDTAITIRDKITVNGISPQIIRVKADPDGYGVVVLT